ncbi:NAD(P)/FAD-dependent oxidoreductase [Chloroflexota bacterium]
MSPKQDVVIIGGGVAGCSIAYHLGKQGVPSLIVERDSVGSQASGKAWGVFSPPAYIRLFAEGSLVPEGSMRPCLGLHDEGIDRIAQFARELKEVGGMDVEYGELPVIRVIFDENDEKNIKKRVAELEKDGLEYHWLEANDIKARFPDIAPDVRRGIIFPSHQVETYRYNLGLAQAAEAKGASIKQGEVTGFRHQGSRVTSVVLATREIETDAVVLAMGPWSGQGASWLGEKISVEVHRDQCMVVEVPKRLPPFRITSAQEGGVAIVPKIDGKVILGRVRHDVVDFDERITEEFRLSVMEAALATMPMLEEAKLVEHRAGLEAWQPNGGEPLLGRLPGFDNVYIATRLATFGIQWSPAVGRIMAELIVNGHVDKLLEPLNKAKNT